MTQNDLILAYLRAGHAIRPLDALKLFGCLRLGARIWELKRDGHPITSTIVTSKRTGKHFAEYRMKQAVDKAA